MQKSEILQGLYLSAIRIIIEGGESLNLTSSASSTHKLQYDLKKNVKWQLAAEKCLRYQSK